MKEEERLAQKIYGAILAGAGSRGGTYGEEDLRRYARYAGRSAEIFYEEVYPERRQELEENIAWAKQMGSMGGGV